jgi:uncharacterized membrane protein
MALIGRLHPVLVHFPIALVLIAAVAEVVAMATGLWDWRAAKPATQNRIFAGVRFRNDLTTGQSARS